MLNKGNQKKKWLDDIEKYLWKQEILLFLGKFHPYKISK